MIKLWTDEQQADFCQKLAVCRRAVLFFDYDGTLAPFVPDRDRALPYPGVREAFERLLSIKRCRTVLVSGRKALELQPLLQSRIPFEVWGAHGGEHLLPTGQFVQMQIPAKAQEGLALAADRIKHLLAEQEIERKPNCVAAHFSQMSPELASLNFSEVEDVWQAIADEFDLELLDFHEGLEIRVPGINKSRAIKNVLLEEPKDAVTAYIGDDVTDEDAFRELGNKSHTILIGRSNRPSAAQWLLPAEPDGRHIIAFLNATVSALS